jgi:type I restriction enzyme, S subunit
VKLPAYPEYRKSEVEWLGELPAHWRVTRCRGLYQERKEFSDAGEEQLLSVSEYYGIKPRSEVIEEGDFLTRADTLEGYRKCYKRDLVMNYMLAWKSGLGCTEYDGIVSPAYAVFALRDVAFHYRYFHYLLRTPAAATEFKRFSSGIIDSRLRLYPATFLGNIFVSVPPSDEQRTIADFLDRETARLDTLVGKKWKLIEKLKEKRAALISRTVTRGLNPNVKLKPSGIEWLGDIPEDWETMRFARCAFFQEGPGLRHWQFTDSGVRVICVTNITDCGIDFSSYQKFISTEEYHKFYRHFTVQIGDLLLSSSGNSWGKVAVFGESDTCMLNTSTIRVHCNSDATLEASLLRWVLESQTTREQLGIAMTGSCQPNFGPTHLARVMVAVPPQPQQTTIANYLHRETVKLDRMMEKVEAAIEKLQEYRAALITAAVTGKIDVRKLAHSPGSTSVEAASTLPV